MILIIAVCILILILFVSCRRNRTTENELIDFDTSTCLKGFAILLVFIHHFGQLLSEIYNGHSFLGYLGVTIFLFISGYVTEKQLLNKGKCYIGASFIKKKLIRLYLPYLLCVLFFALIGGHGFSQTVEEILDVKGDWFLSAISIFFILFLVVNRMMLKVDSEEKIIGGGTCYSWQSLHISLYVYCLKYLRFGIVPH